MAASFAFAYYEGGYDPDLFQEEVSDRLICPVCHMVMCEPQMVVHCGHHFCRACLEQVRQSDNLCPLDRTSLKWQQVVPDRALMREIAGLLVKCDNSPKGCDWIGELRYFELEKHVKDECPETEISCPFKAVGEGCKFKAKRHAMKAHLLSSQPEHLLQAATACSQMQEHIWREAKSPSKPEDRCTVFNWVIPNFNRRQQLKCSDTFYTGPCNTGYCLRLLCKMNDDLEGGYASPGIQLCPGKNDEALEWPFCHRVDLHLLDSEREFAETLWSGVFVDKTNWYPHCWQKPGRDPNCGIHAIRPFRFADLRQLSTQAGNYSLHIRCIVHWRSWK